jgi:hypothetical protein
MAENKYLFSFNWSGNAPTIEQVSAKFGLKPEELDAQFGVIAVDPEANTYTILLDAAAYERISGESISDELEGPFSNPPIAPFGPPESE